MAKRKVAEQIETDIAIIGGGLTGMTLALALNSRGHRVVMLEARDPHMPLPKCALDTRGLAIALQIKLMLEKLDLWCDAIREVASPIMQVHVSERGRGAFVRLCAQDIHVPALGYLVGYQVLNDALLQQIDQRGVQLLAPAQVTQVSQNKQQVNICYEQDEQEYRLQAKLCVAADGAGSFTRNMCGVEVTRHDYGQVALVGAIELKRHHQFTAYERFTEFGPVALLPMKGNYATFVWCVPPAEAKRLQVLPEAEFLVELQEAFGYRAGRFVGLGQVKGFPLQSTIAKELCHERIVFFGNAAHSIHPVAAQGFNLSCRDIAQLVDVVDRAPELTADCWHQFVDAQQEDQERLSSLTHMLASQFDNDSPLMGMARDMGMHAIERMPAVKKRLQRFLMGQRYPAAALQQQPVVNHDMPMMSVSDVSLTDPNHPDVIVVGGGMVGLAQALLLNRQGLSVVVIEPNTPAKQTATDWPLRVSALNHASERLLYQLDCHEAVFSKTGCYQHMLVWDATSSGETHFHASDMGMTHLGHIAANHDVVTALWQQLEKAEGVVLLAGEAASELRQLDDGWLVKCGSKTLLAPLVIGADGSCSWVRRQVGITTRQGSYGQQALVATLKLSGSHQHTAWQRFLPTGPIAMLPLGDEDVVSMVWSTTPEQAKVLQSDAKALIVAINEALGGRLEVIELLNECASFPLRHHHADTYEKDGLVLIGDAAHSIHPLAGQGVNLGFADVAALGRSIQAAREQGRPWHNQTALRQYMRERRAENARMLVTMKAINNGFRDNTFWLRFLRGQGLIAVDHLGVLKRQLTRVAAG